ncbi:uncharacterized protein LOC120351618 [Nilaparvata lugens]|uniref:uncharacterized protein LOC120351618 n=1 Tax=Nilaparvata lugens TaxID=108931 RepID=UPI00193DE130|nr:uncharacterized protein LOC120351618 [Nilaparvata lugens]
MPPVTLQPWTAFPPSTVRSSTAFPPARSSTEFPPVHPSSAFPPASHCPLAAFRPVRPSSTTVVPTAAHLPSCTVSRHHPYTATTAAALSAPSTRGEVAIRNEEAVMSYNQRNSISKQWRELAHRTQGPATRPTTPPLQRSSSKWQSPLHQRGKGTKPVPSRAEPVPPHHSHSPKHTPTINHFPPEVVCYFKGIGALSGKGYYLRPYPNYFGGGSGSGRVLDSPSGSAPPHNACGLLMRESERRRTSK